MSTTELLSTRFSKHLAILNGLVPASMLAWDAARHQLGVNQVNFAIRTTGMIGLVLITLTLLVTPLRRLTGWHKLVGIRRNLGVLGFGYLAAHFAIFFVFDRQGSISSTASEIVQRVYLWFGTGALALMVPLAVTSTDAMVMRLGAPRWKHLQRLAYVIAAAAVVHYYLLVKSDVRLPRAFALAVGALLAYRAIVHYLELRASARAARASLATAAGAAPRQGAFWSGEMILARMFDESPDVRTFRFVPVDGGPLPFTHVAGQYLTVTLTIDGLRINRCYTIASSPTQRAYCEISVKRMPDGAGSRHLHDAWREGQRVRLAAPAGRFVFAGTDEDRVVLIAGGIGITPTMSIVRSLTDRCWPGRIDVLYSVRRVSDIVFRDELAHLQVRFPNLRARVIVSGDRDTPWDGMRGHITRDVIDECLPGLSRGPILVCGPAPMMAAVRHTLVGMGVPDHEIHQEAFVSAARDTFDAPPASNDHVADAVLDGVPPRIAFSRTGTATEPSPGQSVLEAAEDAGVQIPFECRSGICGQCKTRLIAGRVVMDAEDALSARDRSNGLILACQSRAIGAIELDA